MNLKKYTYIFTLISLFSVNLFAQQSFSAKVVGVPDGDTLTVMTKDRRQLMFRITGIDAPEKDQDFGLNAQDFLFSLVYNQTVSVSDVKKDCLDRPTASVNFKNKDLSVLAVETGNAWSDSACGIDENLSKRESIAAAKKIGLWQNRNLTRPADFVKQRQVQAPVYVVKNQERQIFTGLAPIPPPTPAGLYIGMTMECFCRDMWGKRKAFTAIHKFRTSNSQYNH